MAEYPETDIPDSALEEVIRLTKVARAVDTEDGPGSDGRRQLTERPHDPETVRRHRDELLEEYGYIARVREEAEGAVLVCYPETWIDEQGVVHPEAVEDTSEAIEIRLSGRGDQGEFQAADAHNRALVEAVRQTYGDVHGENAAAFADFMGNHYARPVESATAAELEEFRTEYYPRNAWPTDEQAAQLERSLRYVFECAEEQYPE